MVVNKKSSDYFFIILTALLMINFLFIFGCKTIHRPKNTVSTTYTKPVAYEKQYHFFVNHPTLKKYPQDLYPSSSSSGEDIANIRICYTYPEKMRIEFFGNQIDSIKYNDSTGNNKHKTFVFEKGVYPFKLYLGDHYKDRLSGCMAVFNIDETHSFALFGKSESTKLFRPDLIRKAKEGILTNYIQSFDGKNIFIYYLGNRETLYPGGSPTVELDFSEIKNLKAVFIEGKKVDPIKAIIKFNKNPNYFWYTCKYCGECAYNPVTEPLSSTIKRCTSSPTGQQPYNRLTDPYNDHQDIT